LINGGKYPLHSLTITVKDLAEMMRLFERIPQVQFHPEWDQQKDYATLAQVEIPIGDLAPFGNIPLPSVPILRTDHEKTLDIIFTANNGYVFQHTCLRNATNSLPPNYLQAAATKLIFRGHVQTYVDQNYPKETNGEVGCFSTKPK